MSVGMCVCAYVRMCVCAYVRMCVCVCVCDFAAVISAGRYYTPSYTPTGYRYIRRKKKTLGAISSAAVAAVPPLSGSHAL